MTKLDTSQVFYIQYNAIDYARIVGCELDHNAFGWFATNGDKRYRLRYIERKQWWKWVAI